MLKNYFKIAWRNQIKNKGSFFINLGGLSAGMAVAMLIGLWVWDELSFNKYHQNYDRIAQVKVNAVYDGKVFTIESNPIPLGNELRSSFRSDFKYVVMSTATQPHIISSGDKTFTQQGNYMQAEGPEMLSLKMVNGTLAGLKEINSILLSQALAKNIFGNDDPINKIVKIDNKLSAKVTGVYKDLPHNSQFKEVGFIAPFDLYLSSSRGIRNAQNDWTKQIVQIYAQVSPNTNFEKVSAKIKDVKLRHVSGDQAARKPVLFLHPMSKWHLYSKFENGVNVTSEQLKFVWFYSIIGIFVLLLACINFMNLSTARSEKRAKEVGIRKAVGSLRKHLVSQFFSESILVAAFSFIMALGLVQLTLPWFNGVADKEIGILWNNSLFWLAGITFIIITGLLAGIYPALYLSSFNPVKVLKGTFRVGRFAAIPRKILVVVQFTVSIALIIGTIVVYRQIGFTKDRPVGYSRENLLMFEMTTDDFKDKYNVLRNELKNTGVVSELAESSSPVTSIWSTSSDFEWNGKPADVQSEFSTIAVTHEYGKTIGWQFSAGRDFSKELANDSAAFVINETAAKLMGLKNPVGETVKHEGKNYRILGVVKDMVMESPFKYASPTIFFLEGDMNCILIKIKPVVSASNALQKIEKVFKKLFPSAPVDYKFVDDAYASKFASEERISNLASFFAILAIFISCLGLFGLASFVAEQRTKEIGVRKVLGATVFNLWQMLSKDFVALVIISCLIAIPLAWYFLNQWLQNYEYRTAISWWMIAAAIIGAMVITLLTVSFQAIKAALANPVKSLRTE